MEELKTNVTQVPLVIESERDNIQLHKKGKENEKRGPELDEPISNFLEEGNVTKKVHRFYFVKLWPSSNLEARIGEAEKLNEKFNQDLFQISRKLQERTLDRNQLVSRLKWLNNEDHHYRESVAGKRENLDFLQLTLDKFCFANNAYRGRGIKSCSSQGMLDIHKGELDLLQLALDKLYSERYDHQGRSHNSCSSSHELDKHKLHFRMLHGRNNWAEEKRLLKEINGSQQKTISSCFPLNELNDAIRWFHHGERWMLGWRFNEPTRDHKEQIIRERNELTCLKEKAIATAAVKGKLWNSLGSKQAIHDQVKLICTELNGMRREVLLLRATAKRVEKELEKIKKDIQSLQKQLTVARQRKDEVSECILQLRKLHAEEGSGYYQYQSLLKKCQKTCPRERCSCPRGIVPRTGQ